MAEALYRSSSCHPVIPIAVKTRKALANRYRRERCGLGRRPEGDGLKLGLGLGGGGVELDASRNWNVRISNAGFLYVVGRERR